ncbi:putative phosphoribosyltransferase [Geothermobacter ehrlichii]|uniref:Putative phosphoribosyltransferase n=1 Tax=Geothermobacter ehrlichii TaxID=213224 RepID=A0A5D3WG66_9BACT|nr:phosphoribosyltransferase family protein [Geothermobacter ehrlichii]TYO97471.1 putative phosphoribosyltransferase [Geothermobacter ehrlichii]
MAEQWGELYQQPALRERSGVFADRRQAGLLLAELLEPLELNSPLLLAIPAGGVPVGVAIAEQTGWPLDLAVASKITLPWNSEAGYGAVAFDGGVLLNERLLPQLGMSEEEILHGIRQTRNRVKQRNRTLRDDRPLPEVRRRTVILVDDGLASGLTMRVAVNALRKAGAATLIAAVPTAHIDAVNTLRQEGVSVCCANLRSSYPFAVAAAYRSWYDVSELEVLDLLGKLHSSR